MAAEITLQNCEILITGEEAFRAFEKAVLAAQSDIVAGFRLFDFDTKLRSTVRFGEALKQAARHPENITVQADMHGAHVGAGSSLALWPKARGLLEETIGTFEQLKEDAQTLFL